jgi:hypothetical protein
MDNRGAGQKIITIKQINKTVYIKKSIPNRIRMNLATHVVCMDQLAKHIYKFRQIHKCLIEK